MYKSAIAHYKNKYRDGMVKASEASLDVYCAEGRHRVSLQKNGAGQWSDVSKEVGAEDEHDLSPLPQNACRLKLYKDGQIRPAEEFEERDPVNEKLSKHPCGGKGKVPSCEELREYEKQKKEGIELYASESGPHGSVYSVKFAEEEKKKSK